MYNVSEIGRINLEKTIRDSLKPGYSAHVFDLIGAHGVEIKIISDKTRNYQVFNFAYEELIYLRDTNPSGLFEKIAYYSNAIEGYPPFYLDNYDFVMNQILYSTYTDGKLY